MDGGSQRLGAGGRARGERDMGQGYNTSLDGRNGFADGLHSTVTMVNSMLIYFKIAKSGF
jgi:hypothetical protein